MKKKKWRKSIIAGSIIAIIILPASVYASLQPLDLQTIGEQTSFDLETINELPSSNLESIAEEALVGQNNESSLTSREVLLKVPPVVSATQDIFRSINTGDIQGAFNRIIGILGELNLRDPAHESDRVATESENPYSNPQTPEEIYDRQRHADIVRAEISQKLSQVVFGPRGQQALSQQNQEVQKAQQVSQAGQRGVAATYRESTQKAQQSVTYAKTVETQGKKAQSANVTQRVMKAIAAQNEDLAKIGSGNSVQLAHLVKATAYQSAQSSATNSQLTALNDKTQTLAVLGASQNYQAAQINAAIERQNHSQQLKDSLQENAAYQSTNLVYIPGLVSTGDVP